MKSLFILYVADQKIAARFYANVLDHEPDLDVPGMTEFHLSESSVLGLLPADGAARLLGKPADFLAGHREPSAELYLLVDDPSVFHERALANGAKEISPLSPRDWGHQAAYSADPDGHVLVFAKEMIQ